MTRTIVRFTQDQPENPVFTLEEPATYEKATNPYRLLFPVKSFTADPQTGSLLIEGHGLSHAQEVAVRAAGTDDSLPTGLWDYRPYYVSLEGCDEDHIKLSETPGGQPVTIHSAGIGNNRLFAWTDPSRLCLRSSAAITEAMIKDTGETLLNTLRRHPAIGRNLDDCLRAAVDSPPRPICLFFDEVKQRVIESLPWEALYDQAASVFLALDQRWPIVRLKRPDAHVLQLFAYEPPLRIFAVLAATGPNVDASFEWEGLYEATKDYDVLVKVFTCDNELIKQINAVDDWRFSAEQTESAQNLRQQLLGFAPHVLHLFGHGNPNSRELMFGTLQDFRLHQEGSIHVTATQFQQAASPVLPVWMTVLNVCHSAAAPSGPESFASALTRQGFPVVIGMSTNVASQHTGVFTSNFYRSVVGLLKDAPMWDFHLVNWADKLWLARQAIRDSGQGLYWTIPILYTRKEPFEILRIAEDKPGRDPQDVPDLNRVGVAQTFLKSNQGKRHLDINKLKELVRK